MIGPVKLLGSSGDVALDKLVVASLQGIPVGEPAPPSIAQPFTFVILPKASGRSWGCDPRGDSAPGTPRAGGSNGR